MSHLPRLDSVSISADKTWNDERVEKLKKLWTEGFSANQIARHIGGVSRNAVIGKAMRIGLPKRDGSNRRYVARSRKRATKVNATKAAATPRPASSWTAVQRPRVTAAPSPISDASAFAMDLDIDTPEEIEIPEAERKSLVDLEAGDCRWPIGDPQHRDFHFCARRQVPGQPYCEHHLRRAFQPPAPKRRKGAKGDATTEADATTHPHRPADAPAIDQHQHREKEPV